MKTASTTCSALPECQQDEAEAQSNERGHNSDDRHEQGFGLKAQALICS